MSMNVKFRKVFCSNEKCGKGFQSRSQLRRIRREIGGDVLKKGLCPDCKTPLPKNQNKR